MKWQRFAVLLLVLLWLSLSAVLLSAQDGSLAAGSAPQVHPSKLSSTVSVKRSPSLGQRIDEALMIIESSEADLRTLLDEMQSSKKRYQATLTALQTKVRQLQTVSDEQRTSLETQGSLLIESEANLNALESRYRRDLIIVGGAGVVVGIVISTIYSVIR